LAHAPRKDERGLRSGDVERQRISRDQTGRAHISGPPPRFYVKGRHPRGEIDHRNGDRADNRIANLRECSRAENARNVTSRNPSGFKGVRRDDSRWRASITVNGKRIHLGTFDTAEKAAAAYDKAARRYHGEFARTNFDENGRTAGKSDSSSTMHSTRDLGGSHCAIPDRGTNFSVFPVPGHYPGQSSSVFEGRQWHLGTKPNQDHWEHNLMLMEKINESNACSHFRRIETGI
jgi:hypothetical protein